MLHPYCVRFTMAWAVDGLASLTLVDEVRQDMSLPRVVCEYKDVFSGQAIGITSTKGCRLLH